MATTLWGLQTGISRIWAFDSLPTKVPSGASKWDYYYITPEDKTYIRLNNQWVLSHLQLGKGDKGDPGTNGKDGVNATIQVSNILTTTLNATNAAQVTITDSDPSPSNSNWSFNFGIPRGFDGKDGINGTNGIDGKDGINGKDGASATVQVGTVTTLASGSNATVTNSGTASAAIFNFGIPRGADGAAGSGSGNITVLGTTRYCYTEADLRAAVAAHSNGSIMKINVVNNIGLTTPLDLPKSTTATNKKLEFNLGGNTIFDNSGSGLPYLIGRKPSIQSEALNIMQSWGLHIYGGCLQGKGATTGALLDLGATYNSSAHDLNLINAQDGILYKFCLMSTIRNCMSNGIRNKSFSLNIGDWSGSTNSNSQSNHSLIEQCRVFNYGGALSAFEVRGSSGCMIRQCISEGQKPQYHIFWDALGSTVVKDARIEGVHVESIATVSGIYMNLSNGYAVLDGVYAQYAQKLFDIKGAGYPHVYIKNIPWLPGGSTFNNVGTNVVWSFNECNFDVNDVNIWSGSTKPYYYSQEGYNQSKYINYNSMKFNGKTPVTQ